MPQDFSFRLQGLVIIALWTMAVTQPLLNTLSDSATFFVAHDAGRMHIFYLIILIAFLAPLSLIVINFFSAKVSKKLHLVVHFCIIFLLLSAFFLIVFDGFLLKAPIVCVFLSISVGIITAFFLMKFKAVQEIASIASVGAIIFPVLFLFFTPVSSIITGDKVAEFTNAKEFTKLDDQPTTPVVLIVFDEFNPLALLDKSNQIDSVRFPNISKFTDDSTWFPNTAALHNFTFKALPSILTGKTPPKKNLPPTQANYKNNVFTLLGETHDFNVVDELTSLCPKIYCQSEDGNSDFKTNEFAADIKVIFQHIYYPDKWTKIHLPILDTGWKNFGEHKTQGTVTPDAIKLVQLKSKDLYSADDQEIFEDFLKAMQPERNTFDYLYLMFPHTPWNRLPDGRTYGGLPVTNNWNSEAVVEEAYHRYLLQLGMVDEMVGDLMARLKSIDKYDDALIMIVADHGINFKSGVTKRALESPSILHIPFWVKLPNQTHGEVNTKTVTTLDVVPTIADVLGYGDIWENDGKSVFDPAESQHKNVEIAIKQGIVKLKLEDVFNFDAIPNRVEKFGELTSLNLLSNRGSHEMLLGRRTNDLDDLLVVPNAVPTINANFESFKNVDLSSNYLPIMFKGEVSSSDPFEQNHSVAVALNGEIVSIVRTVKTEGTQTFKAILPPAKVKNGSNELEVFLVIHNEGNQTELISIPNISYSKISSINGRSFIEDNVGVRLAFKETGVTSAYASKNQTRENIIIFHGWAIDTTNKTPPSGFAMFYNDEFVRTISVNKETPDLAKMFKAEQALSKSGFVFIVNENDVPDLEDVRIFAIFDNKFASELLRN